MGGGSGVVGILTFYWADDYGAMLQAYALKRKLELLGAQAEIIPYAPYKLTGRYWPCPVYARMENGGMRYYVHRHHLTANLSLGLDFWRRRWKMRRFRREYLTGRMPVRRGGGLSLAAYETVFIGSDQVWNPDITVDLDDAYIGNIPNRGKLAAYGASLGGRTFTEAEREKFLRYAAGFSAISLREQTDAARVEQLLGRKVRDVLDPVLLLEGTEWRRLAEPPDRQDYILIHQTQYHEGLMRCARALSARLGKRILSLSDPAFLEGTPAGPHAFEGIELRCGNGPKEFLGYVRDAFCVLTNSFHGAAFSVLLEKPFLTFRHRTRSVRLEDLLRKLELSGHMVKAVEPEEAMDIWEGTDWEAVRARLEAERESSVRFIREQL